VVAVHRAAWPYRPDLDRVVEAPDGRDAGAHEAVVYPVANHPNGAVHLYEALGFIPYARSVRYVKP
jgi:hypothetical protein